MVTIFTNTRPFKGPFNVIQRNAIKSWLALRPKCEVILFNDEEGTAVKVAKEFGVKCVADVATNEFGTQLLDDVFRQARALAQNEVMAQVNSDIILMNDFLEGIDRVKSWTGDKAFFIVGRRYDININEPLQFAPGWDKAFRERLEKAGSLHGMAGVDYWVFPQNFNFDPPPFNIGRVGMDSWLIYKARSSKIPVIDATEAVTIAHQNHDYPMRKSDSYWIETKRNLQLAGALNAMTMRDANWLLTPEGIKRPPFPRRIFPILSLFYPWRIFLVLQRKLLKKSLV